MIEVTVYDVTHLPVGKRELAESVFNSPVNVGLMHQVAIGYMNNRRQGTASTLGRSEVRGGGRKPFRQKGTGRARQGTIRSPLMRGGGVTFGPHPRSYRKGLPKKMRRSALRSSLSDKASSNRVHIVKELSFPEPKTKQMVQMLNDFKLSGPTLVVHEGSNRNLRLSSRNLPHVELIPASELNALQVLQNDDLVITEAALEEIEQRWG